MSDQEELGITEEANAEERLENETAEEDVGKTRRRANNGNIVRRRRGHDRGRNGPQGRSCRTLADSELARSQKDREDAMKYSSANFARDMLSHRR